MAWYADLLDNKMWPYTVVTPEESVCVPGLPVEGQGLGGPCAVDCGGCH